MTRDADLAIAVSDDEEAEGIVRAIAQLAVVLIERRGFARERNLVDRLDSLIRNGAYE